MVSVLSGAWAACVETRTLTVGFKLGALRQQCGRAYSNFSWVMPSS